MKKNLIVNKLALLLVVVICTLHVLPLTALASSKQVAVTPEGIDLFPRNSLERYAYSQALAKGTTYEEELAREKNAVVPCSYDEYVKYVTKSQFAGNIRAPEIVFRAMISTEAKVLYSRATGRPKEVLNFGSPYASVGGYGSSWSGGGFNVDRYSSTSARFSTTGQFIIDCGSVSVGLDIISYSTNIGAKTKVLTIATVMNWQ